MSRHGSSPIWCLCEKLPRSMLHIAPTHELWCEVCGRRRRPRAAVSSSSDEDEKAANQRQLMLAEQRRAEESRQALVRVKVAMSAQKPNSKSKSKCVNCGGKHKLAVNMLTCSHVGKPKNQEKLCSGRFRHFRKPQRLQTKQNINDDIPESKEQLGTEPIVAPPPSPSSPPSPPTASEGVAKASESLWEQPNENMPNLVAFAHEVFNRPLHLRKCQPTYFDTLFVSDFIPLDKPITDASGGAISKRRKIFGRPIRPHRSRSLPPLAQVLSEILDKQNVRAKGGGVTPKETEFNNDSTASQFAPFDCYEGPSEDALVVESARHMLRQPNALYINQREDLPSTRLLSFESEPSSDFSSSSPFEMPSAPPAERQRHSYVGVGAPLRMHDVMKAVAQSGLSDSSASSCSSSSISRKSVSSTQPIHQQSLRSCGGEEFQYIDKQTVKAEPLPFSVVEKILWLMDQQPDSTLTEESTQDAIQNQESQETFIENSHSESVKGLLQFMESLHIAEGGDTDNTSKLLKNSEDELKSSKDNSKLDSSLSNDMSNELNVNSLNKSAGDAKYVKVLSNVQHQTRSCQRSCKAKKARTPSSSSSTSMWSAISGFFTQKITSTKSVASERTVASRGREEQKPLRSTENLHYGTIRTTETKTSLLEIKQALQKCKGSKCSNQPTKLSKSSCRKCVNNLSNNIIYKTKIQSKLNSLKPIQQRKEHKSSCKFHTARDSKATENSTASSVKLSTSSLYQTARTSLTKSELQINTDSENSKKNILEQKMQLGNIFEVFRRAPEPSPLVFYPVKIIELVRHECIVIDKPKAVAIFQDLSTKGLKKEKVTEQILTDAPSIFLEFRTPDIEQIVSKEVQSYDFSHIYELETAKAYLKSFQQTQESTIITKLQENVKPQKHIPTGWPTFTRKHKKQQIKYKAVQMEMTYTLDESEEKNLKKSNKCQVKAKRVNATWIANKSVQKKIDEMMTKPIKLLSSNKECDVQN